MAKHFIMVVLIAAVASIILRLILANAPITSTWLTDITVTDTKK